MTQLLIWFAILISGTHCRRGNHTLQLMCNITTPSFGKNGPQETTRPISAVNTCHENYKNDEIIKKCEYLIDSQAPGSKTLFKPVINNEKTITYWNEYCAACNNETNSVLKSSTSWKTQKSTRLMCMFHALATEGDSESKIAEITVKFNRDYMRESMSLLSTFNKFTNLQCLINDDWPMIFINYAFPCMTDNFRNDLNARLKSCQYIKKDLKICLEMRFMIEGLDYVYDPNGRINVINNDSEMNFTIDEKFIAHKSDINSMLFMCTPDVSTYGMAYWSKIIRMMVSVIFISIYLTINFNAKYFQSFANKIIFSYSIALLIMYLGLVLVYLLFFESCMDFFLLQFSWFFHFFWTMLLSLELCRLTYSSLRKRLVPTSSQHKRFLVYCFVGFVLPVILPTIYFSLLLYDNRCPPIPGYVVVPCRAIRDSTAEYFFDKATDVYNQSFSFLIPTLFLMQAFVLIYLTKCGPTRVRSTANRSNVMILMKMAYIMGTHWMLYEICIWLGRDYSPILIYVFRLSQYCSDLQGVFVFFAFGFKRRMLGRAGKMCCGERKTVEGVQSSNDVTEMTSQSLSRSLSEQKSLMTET